MLSTVWLLLTPVGEGQPPSMNVMFGPGGVTRFYKKNGNTYLAPDLSVQESPEYIMSGIASIRGTEGRFNGEEEQSSESRSKSQESSPEASN